MAQFDQRIIYLAAPYSDPDPHIRLSRYESATAAAAYLTGTGRIVFSPLTLTHPMDLILSQAGETLGSEYWVAYDEAFMEICSEIVVLRLNGWERSSGVKREIEFFKARGRCVSFIDPPANERRPAGYLLLASA